MNRRTAATIIALAVTLLVAGSLFAEKQDQNDRPFYAVVGGQEQRLTPFPNDDERTRKIMKRNDLQDEGFYLAKQGRYDDAILKFHDAMDPSSLNKETDKSTALGAIRDIHQRQGQFELALREHEEWFYNRHPNHEPTIDKRLELLSLLEWQKTGSPQAVHDHIRYLREKYKAMLPPNELGSYSGIVISTIVHLYDTVGDADGGIAFVDEVIASMKKYTRGSLATQREIAEYERVRQSFEDDKRTGIRGHLRKALETSSFISW